MDEECSILYQKSTSLLEWLGNGYAVSSFIVGGNGDNPDAMQFRHYLREVMVDAVLLSSTGSNCKDDIDNFLLSLKPFTEPSADGIPMPCPEVVDIEENVEIPHSVQELMSVFTQSS